MVQSSLSIKNLVPIPPLAPITKDEPSIQTTTIALPYISYTLTNPPTAPKNLFQQFALQKIQRVPSVSFFSISSGSLSIVPFTDQAIISSCEEYGFIDGCRPITKENKETLTALLDLAAEIGCTLAVACVDKSNPKAQEIIRSYMEVGFTIAQNSTQNPGHVCLSFEL
eukprot:TRINITY_DN700_c0_g1_i1.p1 TRINITY_DN700_c0_g1~~TRINITY_DN700_c0_g1_i1.p1  ORF type:complete len:168 (-),score=26.65 TRINITY_DN700_c0_g1_i1:63-566(-)